MSAELFTIPPFYIGPIRGAAPRETDQATARGAAWMSHMGIDAPQVAAAEIGRLVALTAPGTLPERLQPVVDLNLWYHAFDDYGDVSAPAQLAAYEDRVVRLVHILDSPEASTLDDPFARALGDVRRRIASFATPAQLTEWVSGVQNYLMYELWEKNNRACGRTPDLEDYTTYCVQGRAARPSMSLLGPLAGFEAPTGHPDLRALTQISCLIATWDNDIYSWPKERFEPDHQHNLLNVLAHAEGTSPRTTLHQAVAMRDRTMVLFLRLSERVTTCGPPGAARYAEALGSWLRGQIEWAMTSLRFADPRFGAVMPTAWAARPTDAADEPLAIRPVAWWWTRMSAPRCDLAA